MWRGTSPSARTSSASCGRADGAARPAEADRQAGEHGQLGGERLGRGDADLGAGQRRQHRIGLAGDGGGAHVDDGRDALALRPAVAQRRQGIGRLAGLRDEHGEPARRQRRLAVAELRGDVDLHRQARIALQPVLADQPGEIGRAAGRDGDAVQLGRVDAEVGQRDAALGEVDVVGERMADHLGLLVDLLGHEVAEVALVDQQRARHRLDARRAAPGGRRG